MGREYGDLKEKTIDALAIVGIGLIIAGAGWLNRAAAVIVAGVFCLGAAVLLARAIRNAVHDPGNKPAAGVDRKSERPTDGQ